MVGYTGGAWGEVTFEVVDLYDEKATKGLAFSEVKLNAATIDDL